MLTYAQSFSRTCTSSLYTSTYDQIEVELHVPREVATLGLSLFVCGLGLGPMVCTSMTDTFCATSTNKLSTKQILSPLSEVSLVS
jgi:hypothetical protein